MNRSNMGAAAIAAVLVATIAATGVGQAIGTNPDFDLAAVEEEAYWYSRYSLGHLTMRSGMGETYVFDPTQIDRMIASADADPEDGDTVSLPLEPALLRTVYAAGDPAWTQAPDSADFATLRWGLASFDTRVTGSALGWTIVTELEWAKQFHIDASFGTPEDDFGAQGRFTGLLLTAMAVEQATAWIGLHAADRTVRADDVDPFILLMALSDLARVLGAETMPRSDTNRYFDPEKAAAFRHAADEQFDRVLGVAIDGMTVRETATAIQGLVWYASATDSAERQALALERIGELGALLIEASKENAAERGYALRGLIEVHRVIGSIDALRETRDLVEELADDFDFAYGIFASQTTYTIDDVAAIVGGLNAARRFGDADGRLIERVLPGFFEAVVNLSGLQQSVPPTDSDKGAFEQGAPAIFYGYPGIPLSGEVGEFGVAPVFASSVTFDPGTGEWIEIDGRFDTAGAMHTASEFIWLHTDEVDGFPIVEPIAATPPEPMPEDVDAPRAGLSDFQNALIYLFIVLVGLTLVALRGGTCN